MVPLVAETFQAFPKRVRLRRRREFLAVQERGHKHSADCLLCLSLPQVKTQECTRLGLTVSTKVGPAVVRNRIRRVLRELFRKRKEQWPLGLDVVLIAKPSAAQANTERLTHAFERLTRELQKKYS